MTPLPHERPGSGPSAAFALRLQAALPVVETERLTLRAPRIEDFATYLAIADSPGGKFLMEEPSREAAWLDFAQMVACWLLRGYGLWAVELRATGECLGFAVLGFEPGDHEPELGYMLRPGAEGKGYAAEAARAARDHGFGPLGLATLVSTIDHGNLPSRRLAEGLGAVRDAAAEAAHGHQILVYRHPRPEAPA